MQHGAGDGVGDVGVDELAFRVVLKRPVLQVAAVGLLRPASDLAFCIVAVIKL
jgi:hypothetical protein